jgi:hypothetical protein
MDINIKCEANFFPPSFSSSSTLFNLVHLCELHTRILTAKSYCSLQSCMQLGNWILGTVFMSSHRVLISCFFYIPAYMRSKYYFLDSVASRCIQRLSLAS